MIQPKLTKEQIYTYEDYLTWDDDVRYELIDGVAYALASPSSYHQRILINLTVQLESFLKGKKCKLFVAPFDVKLESESSKDTVVQPDLLVICDKTKIAKNSYNGIPDLVIEILSPSTASYDCIKKLHCYQQAKVPEYWIVDPHIQKVYVFSLENDSYVDKVYEKTEALESKILQGCHVILEDIFEDDVENDW